MLRTRYPEIVAILKKEKLVTDEIPSRAAMFRWKVLAEGTRESIRKEENKEIVKEADSKTRIHLEKATEDIDKARLIAFSCNELLNCAAKRISLAALQAQLDGEITSKTKSEVSVKGIFKDPAEILMQKYPRDERDRTMEGSVTDES
jgi:hypothetical protein